MGATHVYTAGGGAPGTVAASMEPWLTPVAPTLLCPTGVTQQGHPGVRQEEAPQPPGPGASRAHPLLSHNHGCKLNEILGEGEGRRVGRRTRQKSSELLVFSGEARAPGARFSRPSSE